MSLLTLEAKLERTEPGTPWGFRMQGGKDFSSPLTIQRVNPGSLAAKCGLQVGDIILKIGNTDTNTLRHKEAQNSILQAGNRLDLLLQRIREKRYQNGGGGGVRGPGGSYETFSAPTFNAGSFQNAGGPGAPPTFNTAPKLFGSQPAPAPFKPAYDDGLAQRTQNLALSPGGRSDASFTPGVSSAAPPPPPPPSSSYAPSPAAGGNPADLRSVAEKYADLEEPTGPSQHQSRSFKYLQGIMDSGQEPPSALKTVPPPALQARAVSPRADNRAAQAPAGPAVVLGPSKPGTVKAIMSQRYNTPIGLYSSNEVMKQFDSQSKLLVSEENASGGVPPPPHAAPKPVSMGVSFTPKPAPVAPAAPASKPWTPAGPPAGPPGGPRPFGGGAAPKPTGVGAKRGRVGEAVVSNPGTGRIPVCSGCGTPIRGPFVTALGNCWCPDHFICANPQCGVKLIDIGFVEEGGKLYCERDYERYLAPHCKRCNGAIIGECVNALQSTWHPDCFICSQCKLPIGGNQFHIEDGKPFCEKDWAAMFQTMCAGCEFPIEPGDKWVEAMSKNFHAECFNCNTCQVSLEGQPFVARAGKAFCKKHAR